MNTRFAKSTILSAVLTIGCTLPSHAVLTYVAGDIFLGFRQDGNSASEYIIDIGSGALYRDATSQLTLSINSTSFATDMSRAFGSDWNSASPAGGLIFWGTLGTTQNTSSRPAPDNIARLIYLSEPFGNVTNPTALADSDQSGYANDIGSFQLNWQTASNTAKQGAVANSAVLDPGNGNSWTNLIATEGSTPIAPIENLFGSIQADRLDFFRIPQTGTGQLATNEGAFRVDLTTNQLFFAPPVPEPTTASLFLLTTGIFALRRFRSLSGSLT